MAESRISRTSNKIWVVLFAGLLPVQSANSLGQDSGPVIENPAQSVGKEIKFNRLPLCEPGKYKGDLAHAGMEATVVSAKPSNIPAIPKVALDGMSPAGRDLILDQQKAALLLLRFDDGITLDTCAAIELAATIGVTDSDTLRGQIDVPSNLRPQVRVWSIHVCCDYPTTCSLFPSVRGSFPLSVGNVPLRSVDFD
jgi:hypothetical protein